MPIPRKKHLLHELAALPWWVSVIAAVVVYVAIRWLLPAVGGSNAVLRGLGEALRDKAWMFAVPFVVVAGVAEVNAWYRRRLLDTQSGVESLRAMTWQDFERLVGEAYRRQGYVVEEVGGNRRNAAFFVSTGTFTPDAVEFARGKPLDLVDGPRLADLIKGLQPRAARPTEATAPACPKCGGGMVRRLAKRRAEAGHEFWGCLRFPKCSGTHDIEATAR